MRTAVITVEFFGIARERAGVSRTSIEGENLGQVLRGIGARFPRFRKTCLAAGTHDDGGSLSFGYCANLNGDRFVSDPQTTLRDGDTLLILSADAGG